jgi:hypothetical protein
VPNIRGRLPPPGKTMKRETDEPEPEDRAVINRSFQQHFNEASPQEQAGLLILRAETQLQVCREEAEAKSMASAARLRRALSSLVSTQKALEEQRKLAAFEKGIAIRFQERYLEEEAHREWVEQEAQQEIEALQAVICSREEQISALLSRAARAAKGAKRGRSKERTIGADSHLRRSRNQQGTTPRRSEKARDLNAAPRRTSRLEKTLKIALTALEYKNDCIAALTGDCLSREQTIQSLTTSIKLLKQSANTVKGLMGRSRAETGQYPPTGSTWERHEADPHLSQGGASTQCDHTEALARLIPAKITTMTMLPRGGGMH